MITMATKHLQNLGFRIAVRRAAVAPASSVSSILDPTVIRRMNTATRTSSPLLNATYFARHASSHTSNFKPIPSNSSNFSTKENVARPHKHPQPEEEEEEGNSTLLKQIKEESENRRDGHNEDSSKPADSGGAKGVDSAGLPPPITDSGISEAFTFSDGSDGSDESTNDSDSSSRRGSSSESSGGHSPSSEE
ncbi:hypothetical protein AOQ84DRAFT_77166 [Glonium stellatum]|uniref:Uncharacterized protein n=1 Tax=Glonium stellatum TaxID=574774 RepID=A0A8E2EX70_9PEZI|nr:hypothetical protein AOQ84DRAFT_77166 [Glonium stellatum]